MNIVTICLKTQIGISTVFRHGEKIGLWKFYFLDEVERSLDADLCILGGWSKLYEPLLKDFNKVWVLWGSPLLQSEVSPPELTYLKYVIENPKIERVWCGDEDLTYVLGGKSLHLPYPIDVETILKYKQENIEREGLGLFMPSKPYKNIATQLAAVKLLQNKMPNLILHTNVTGRYAKLARWLKIKCKFYKWMPEPEYLRLLSSLRLTLYVTLSECFAYGALTPMLLETPCLVSRVVEPRWNRPLCRELVVDNTDSPSEIANKASIILDDELWPSFSRLARGVALEVAERNNRVLRERIKELIEE